MPNRICFLVYRDWEEVFEEFDDKTFRELISAIFRYGFDREEKDLSPTARVAMKLIKPVLERDWNKYSERADRNRKNGAKGGRPTKTDKKSDYTETQMFLEKPTGLFENQSVLEKPTGHINIKYKIQDIKNENRKINSNNISDKSELPESKTSEVNTNSDINEIVEFYNSTCDICNMSKCMKLSEKRKSMIKARLRESGKDCIFEVITIASQSDFLNGNNDRGWKADIEFIMNPNKFISIYEGKYNNSSNNGSNNGSNTARAVEMGARAIQSILLDDEES